MEAILIDEVLVKPLRGVEERIELGVSRTVLALAKALFVCAVTSQEDFHSGHLKDVLFVLYVFHVQRDPLAQLKVLHVQSACRFLLHKLRLFTTTFLALAWLFLDESSRADMDTVLAKALMLFASRYIFGCPDFLLISCGVLSVLVYRLTDRTVAAVDFVLLTIVIVIFGCVSRLTVVNDSVVFYIFVLAGLWMLLKGVNQEQVIWF